MKSITRALDFKNDKIVKTLAEASGQMIEGEIEELAQSFNLELTEKAYFKIISKKQPVFFGPAVGWHQSWLAPRPK